MVSKRLERLVTDALAHEDATHALECTVRGAMLSRHWSGPNSAEHIEERTALVMRFIRLYVTTAPALLSAMYAAGEEEGVSRELEPIFIAVEDYFLHAVDLIPDHLGLIGMTDDAYMVQSMLRRLSDEHGAQAGVPLISIDLAPANELMRRLIGEPLATTLDAIVDRAVGQPDVQIARQQLVRAKTRLRLKVANPYADQLISGDDLDLHLGVLGGRAG